jgi:hypothetical protein
MIIKLHKPGRSFKGAVRYLTHDKDAKEKSERVAWTHTLNCANDHVQSAVDEMIWTVRAADQLKRAAGIGTGGSKLERPVKHFTLAWHASESPTREHMIEVTKQYLKHMGMDDRQAILVSHNDTPHAHVHVVLNVVSPEDGRALKTAFEFRRTQSFALDYERSQYKIFCEERLKDPGQREKSPTRAAHETFKAAERKFDKAEAKRYEKPDYLVRPKEGTIKDKEWEALKDYQRQQREQFKTVDGKQAFRDIRSAVYREVRQEFRGQWKALYAAKRQGGDPAQLASLKAGILAAQKTALEKRRDEACDLLREARDQQYAVLLKQQQFDRDELGKRQTLGLRTYRLFDMNYPVKAEPEPERRPRNAGPWKTADQIADRQEKTDAFTGAAQRAHEVVDRGSATPARFPNRNPKAGASNKPVENRETPVASPRENTEATVEKQRVLSSREMTDQAREKAHKDAAAELRASWNQHRRSRGRGD